MTAAAAIELVLPSGRFARIRPLLWSDLVLCWDNNPMLMLTMLAARVVTVDDAALDPKTWFEFPVEEMLPIATALNGLIKQVMDYTKGVA